jgi:hypothetical protein
VSLQARSQSQRLGLADRAVAQFSQSLVSSDQPELSDEVVQLAAAHVVETRRRMPDGIRHGVTGLALLAHLVVLVGSATARTDTGAARRRLVIRIAATRLPGMSDYVRLIRSLTLHYRYECAR